MLLDAQQNAHTVGWQDKSLSGRCETLHVVPPVAHVGVHAPVEAGVALSPVRGPLSTLVVHRAAVWSWKVSLGLRAGELHGLGSAGCSVLLPGPAPVLSSDLHQFEQGGRSGAFLDSVRY